MTFTYDLGTEIGKIRLAIGDTSAADTALSDEELQALRDEVGTWQAAAVYACDALIARYSRDVNMSLGPRSESRSNIVDHYIALKQQLCGRYGIPVNMAGSTTPGRVDGYSERAGSGDDFARRVRYGRA